MTLGENIFNAFEVVNKTHENVDKLIQFCKTMALEKEEFDLMSPKFLRYKSDLDYWGWNTTRIFLVFQDRQDRLLKNGWRNGPIYVLEILLYNVNEYYGTSEPILELAKFEYENIKSFEAGILSTDYYGFIDPLDCTEEYEETKDGLWIAEMPEEMKQKYWGVKRVVVKYELLTNVNYENAYEVIFGTFKRLEMK